MSSRIRARLVEKRTRNKFPFLSTFTFTFTLPYITFTLHYITLHYITLHHITLHHITSYHITSHHIALHSQFMFCRIMRRQAPRHPDGWVKAEWRSQETRLRRGAEAGTEAGTAARYTDNAWWCRGVQLNGRPPDEAEKVDIRSSTRSVGHVYYDIAWADQLINETIGVHYVCAVSYTRHS